MIEEAPVTTEEIVQPWNEAFDPDAVSWSIETIVKYVPGSISEQEAMDIMTATNQAAIALEETPQRVFYAHLLTVLDKGVPPGKYSAALIEEAKHNAGEVREMMSDQQENPELLPA